jgi:hypothetical protein
LPFNESQLFDFLLKLYGGIPKENGTKEIKPEPKIQEKVKQFIKDYELQK